MSLWQSFQRWLTPAETRTDQTFSMDNRGSQPPSEERGPVMLRDALNRSERVVTRIDSVLEALPDGKEQLDKAGDLTASLDENVKRLKALFHLPANKDLVVRELEIATQPPTRATISYMEGITDKMVINEHLLKSLMLLAHLDHHLGAGGEDGTTAFSVDTVMKRLLPSHQVKAVYDMKSVAQGLLAGDTMIFFEGAPAAVEVETKSPPARSVPEAKNEQSVEGPHDAFNEAWRINVALVRRRLKDPRVVTEILTVGQVSSTYIGMMYIEGITSPKLVAEVRRRVESLKVDVINSAGVLQQYIEDNPATLLPTLLTTERPDRAAAYLSEGHVVLFPDTSPRAVVCPATLWTLLQTPEDYYLRWPYGTLLRFLRLFAVSLAVLVPAVYLAIINFHQEMVPTQLLMFIANSREGVPMPALVELLLMDVTFELIREAGVRIPNVIGPTLGLVASLVLGQAAVSAKIVSPTLIIIVAITGLASFAIPSYMASFGLRALRFLFLAAAVGLGFYGIAAFSFMLAVYLAGLRSFGVPFLSPVAPSRNALGDVIVRPPLFNMEMRPAFMHPLDRRRQAEVVRKWDPYAQEPGGGDQPDQGGGDA